jgi:maspardin
MSYLQLESLSQKDLASRLTLNCVNCYVEPQKLNGLSITILDVFDDYALSNTVREDMYKCYPSAKLAHLKSGGNFPYLSRSDEVNLHLQVSVMNTTELDVFQCTADIYLNREPAGWK